MAAVAPMDLVVNNDHAAIPLRCTICPRKPNFSDLSHLLTHMASKSHLSHKFKIELRAKSDGEALEEFNQYQTWYHKYGIDTLLAERVLAKDKKKTGRRGRPINAVDNRPELREAASRAGSVKTEPEEYIDRREPRPMMAPWPTAPTLPSNASRGHPEDASFRTPTLKRFRSDESPPNTPEDALRPKVRRRLSETEFMESDPVAECPVFPSETTDLMEDDNEANKLKGVRYPGMGLFDAADDDQKRKRNQRKDDSVVKQMEEASSGIEPTECVWTEIGELQRSRDIYATPSVEGSPDRKSEELDEPKPKRGRRSAAAAATLELQRQKRSTARTPRSKTSGNRKIHEEDGLPEPDDNESIVESRGSADLFDVFRDQPKPNSGRTDTSLGGPSLELRRRPALRSRDSNLSMASPAPKAAKSSSFLPVRDIATTPFTSQASLSASHYFSHHHPMGGGNLNPLCAQNRNGYFHSYGYPNYGSEPKASATSFQAINAMNLGNMAFGPFSANYTSDPAHDHVEEDFEL